MGNRRKGRERRREEGKTEGEEKRKGRESRGRMGIAWEREARGWGGVKSGQQERERTERGGKD